MLTFAGLAVLSVIIAGCFIGKYGGTDALATYIVAWIMGVIALGGTAFVVFCAMLPWLIASGVFLLFWNVGITAIFASVPTIGYLPAFAIIVGLSVIIKLISKVR